MSENKYFKKITNFFSEKFSLKPNDAKKDIEEFDINDYYEIKDNDFDHDYVIIDGKKMRKKKKKIHEDSNLKKIIDDLTKLKPDDYKINQQRNLDRETGGTEVPNTFITSSVDVWDERFEEIKKMAEIEDGDYNSDDKASMISEMKRKKKQRESLDHNPQNTQSNQNTYRVNARPLSSSNNTQRHN